MRTGQFLGQHFLRSPKALEEIVAAAHLSPLDAVVEIGPGEGVLTEQILKHTGHVIAVEKDPSLITVLEKRFEKEINEKKLLLIEEDVRNFDPEKHNLKKGEYKLVANIPYYITGEILRQFLGGEIYPSTAVLLIQKEVAERVIEKDGKSSILSISVNVYGQPRKVSTVKSASFSPSPKVDSAILSINNISKKFFENISEKSFFETVKTGFSQKRKQLKNTLNKKFGQENVATAMRLCSLPGSIRAEKASLEQWKCLVRELHTSSLYS